MSGLYDGLYDDIAKKKDTIAASPAASSTAQPALPPHLLLARKRAAASAPATTAHVAKKHEVAQLPSPPSPALLQATSVIDDPYDPAVPNVYEQLHGIRDDADVKKLRRPPPPTIGKELLRKAGGWKDGQRLGKRGQGIARPIDGVRLANGQEQMESLMGSSVLLVRNACGAGDVDEELKPELTGECETFGVVRAAVVWEAPEELMATLNGADHVRVFVHFEKGEAAEQAKSALHGRFFGGRQLDVSFYSEDAFKSERLAP